MDFPAHSRSILSTLAVREIELASADVTPCLMERAGCAAAGMAFDLLAGQEGCVLVLAGPGNNGGDAYVVARELLQRGVRIVLVSLADPDRMPHDAAQARSAWLAAGGQICRDFIGKQWVLVIDGIFGIGLTRPVEGVYAEWIDRVNAMPCPVLALDIPSGLDADTGSAPGPVVTASHTATFIALKPGLITLDGPDHCGRIRVFDLDLAVPVSAGREITPACFAANLRPRRRNVHKGHFGAAGVIGGASGMTGAGMLAARAALRLGAGKVFLGLLDDPGFTVDPLYPEIMIRAPGDLHLMADALALGPGLGSSDAALQHLRRALTFSGPLVLDADALNLIAEHAALQTLLAQRQPATVITPHPAEAARLLRASVASVQADRLASACELASRFRVVAVLKGCGSVVVTPDRQWFINTSGNAGMAAGGMGDVLTGLVLALLAQGWEPGHATLAAVHLHGCAADRLVSQGLGPVGLGAGETIDAARAVFNRWLHCKT
jgi:hydroxyethylthiazole kinase-like uncharacterized protein yjeF